MRQIAHSQTHPVGLGCMGLSHGYGQPPSESEAIRFIHAAIDMGVTHFDTAALYGFGRNESLLGLALKGRRDEIFLASKCGLTGVDGKRVLDGRPQTLHRTIEQSLQRLNTDCIDLYYLHRRDKAVPIEESVGALSDMVAAGKIRAIGLSEVSAELIEQAHSVHAIAAVQSEYSLWTRNVEIQVSDLCRRLKIALVAFSPLGRGFLANAVPDPESLAQGDLRRNMPRFQQDNFSRNMLLLARLNAMSEQAEVTAGQLALAWLLHQAERLLPIPGTANVAHLAQNMAAAEVRLSKAQLVQLDQLFNRHAVSGARYTAATQCEIDTEEF